MKDYQGRHWRDEPAAHEPHLHVRRYIPAGTPTPKQRRRARKKANRAEKRAEAFRVYQDQVIRDALRAY